MQKKILSNSMVAIAAALLLGIPHLLLANDPPPQVLRWQEPVEPPKDGEFVGEAGIPLELMTSGFLDAHPDLRWRREGLHEFANQRYGTALERFTRAARYGDKPAQAMLAEMHWKGIGTPQDKAMGYAWMDLAAERMYPNFVILRERYWGELDGTTQADAIQRGQALLAEYGDEVTKPRLAKVFHRERRTISGRVAQMPNQVHVRNGPAAGQEVSTNQFYARKYWNVEEYTKLQDEIWGAPPPSVHVSVGELENASAEKKPPQNKAPQETKP